MPSNAVILSKEDLLAMAKDKPVTIRTHGSDEVQLQLDEAAKAMLTRHQGSAHS